MSYEIGDLVVLSSGSMRMGVEKVEGDMVHTVWCHEGSIGRDAFPAVLLRKWEHREEDSGPRKSGGEGYSKGKPYGGDRSPKPRGKPGWDGKPREKTHFRKD